MLRNKKAIYILIPVNVFVWGYFLYNFLDLYSSGDAPVVQNLAVRKPSATRRDTVNYQLNLSYPDPFLKGSSHVSVERRAIGAKNMRPVISSSLSPVAKPKPPDIRYIGVVKNNSSGAETALVSVNGVTRFVKARQEIEGVAVTGFSRDSLMVRWGEERIVVRR